jgi:hypothetical protein
MGGGGAWSTRGSTQPGWAWLTAAAPAAAVVEAPHKAVADAGDPSALKATRGLIWGGAGVAVAARAMVGLRHSRIAAVVPTNFLLTGEAGIDLLPLVEAMQTYDRR